MSALIFAALFARAGFSTVFVLAPWIDRAFTFELSPKLAVTVETTLLFDSAPDPDSNPTPIAVTCVFVTAVWAAPRVSPPIPLESR